MEVPTVFMRLRQERGAAAAEFAILLPIFVVILFAVISFGLALTRLVTYVSAAREGARYAAVHCEPEASECTLAMLQDRVTNAANGFPVDTTNFTVSTDCTLTPGEPVQISWTQDVPLQIPLLPDMTFTKTIEGSFRCE
jgi:Flp pilus assembly pilin Flp